MTYLQGRESPIVLLILGVALSAASPTFALCLLLVKAANRGA
jgi:hypothetical protein